MKTIISIFTIIFLFFPVSLWAVDLQNASLKELVTERPDLIQAVKSGEDEGTTVVSVVKDAQGRVKTWIEKRKNLDGVVIGKRVDKYTYYSTDSVNEIIQEKYKGAKLTLISKQKVKHYLDGTQPDVIPIDIPAKL
jgi:hypothetical protein